MFLTIFTPVYNREKLIPRLFESLKAQTDKDFEWVVVNDGSTDNTEALIKSYMQENVGFDIIYRCQKNGGKHRAANLGVEIASGEWFFIVDSDDWLDIRAVDIIKKRIREVDSDNTFCGITPLRVFPDGKTIGTEMDRDILDSDFFSYRFIHKMEGDRAEIVRTAIMKQFPFPEFKGENFLAEHAVWFPISARYKTRYTSDPIYYCEYQEGGLTDLFSKLQQLNPLGTLYGLKVTISHPLCSLKEKIRHLYYYKRYEDIAAAQGEIIPHNCRLTKRQRALIPLSKVLYRIKKLF